MDCLSVNKQLLSNEIVKTLEGEPLDRDTLIAACDEVSRSLNENEHLPLLLSLGLSYEKARTELFAAKEMLSRAYLERRVITELGEHGRREFSRQDGTLTAYQTYEPLGVLFHISAGNMEGLPAFSALEGLLTGNINLLKLPSTDTEISKVLLRELTKRYPLLERYVYIFDFPSSDLETMTVLAKLANAVVIWGADEAVLAVRRLADADTKIIEWGHKLSFAYVTPRGENKENLRALARSICESEQLLCNSCQGIFYDSTDKDELLRFGEQFSKVLAEVSKECPYEKNTELIRATASLGVQNERLTAHKKGNVVFRADDSSVIVSFDRKLTGSYMFRNCWVRALPRGEIISALFVKKGYLQTAALLSADDEREALSEKLKRAGLSRITRAESMLNTYCGQPHDGEFALRRYCRIVSNE